MPGEASGETQKVRDALPGKAMLVLQDGPLIGERVVDVKDFEWPLPDEIHFLRVFGSVVGMVSEVPDDGEHNEVITYGKLRDSAFAVSAQRPDDVIVGAVYEYDRSEEC